MQANNGNEIPPSFNVNGARSDELQTVLITHWATMVRQMEAQLRTAHAQIERHRQQNQLLYNANVALRSEISDAHLALWREEDQGADLTALIWTMLQENDLDENYARMHQRILTRPAPEIIDLTTEEELDDDEEL
jgi:hypothetical protein